MLAIGLFVGVLFLMRDHRMLQRYTYTAMFVGLLLSSCPCFPFIGAEINGARIWVLLDPRRSHLRFQPAEIAKIVLIVFFAGYLVVKRDVVGPGAQPRVRHRPSARTRPRPDPGRVGGVAGGAWCSNATSARRCSSSVSS